MDKIKWSKQNPAYDADINKWAKGYRLAQDARDIYAAVKTSFVYDVPVTGYPKGVGVAGMELTLGRLEDIVLHIQELPKLKDGVQLNDNLWVRIQFMDWEAGS